MAMSTCLKRQPGDTTVSITGSANDVFGVQGLHAESCLHTHNVPVSGVNVTRLCCCCSQVLGALSLGGICHAALQGLHGPGFGVCAHCLPQRD